jgi:uncharacterized protein (TIGR02246 family)
MRAATISGLALAACLACTVPHALAAGPMTGEEEAKKAILETNEKYEAAVKEGDAAAIAAMYTSDGIILPPDHAMVHGRTGAEKLWNDFFKLGAKSMSLNTENVERAGNYAIETGTFTFTIQPERKDAQASVGKYVVVWKRQKDGSWKLHRDIWNSSPEKKK